MPKNCSAEATPEEVFPGKERQPLGGILRVDDWCGASCQKLSDIREVFEVFDAEPWEKHAVNEALE
jgi:hypothetical protein